jgi:Brp/Blh family beta-carotene 15,15'-monooxygenase
MKKILDLQSNLFIAISLIVLILNLSLTPKYEVPLFFLALGCIVIFGVPHGSLDVLFAKKTYRLTKHKNWLVFLLVYILVSISIIFLWFVMPNLFFILFLTLSALHFSDDINTEKFSWLKLTYGLSIIILPSMLNHTELANLYSMIIEKNMADDLVWLFRLISFPVLTTLAVQLIINKIEFRDKVEIFTVICIFVMLHPIYSFTIYFCMMHSARHLIRSRFFLDNFSWIVFIGSLILPTIVVILIGFLIMFFLQPESIDSYLIKVIFIGLASLTIPHAWVLKKANFLKWIQKHN